MWKMGKNVISKLKEVQILKLQPEIQNLGVKS